MELLPLVVESSIEMPWSLQEHPPLVTARVLQTPHPCDETWLALSFDSTVPLSQRDEQDKQL